MKSLNKTNGINYYNKYLKYKQKYKEQYKKTYINSKGNIDNTYYGLEFAYSENIKPCKNINYLFNDLPEDDKQIKENLKNNKFIFSNLNLNTENIKIFFINYPHYYKYLWYQKDEFKEEIKNYITIEFIKELIKENIELVKYLPIILYSDINLLVDVFLENTDVWNNFPKEIQENSILLFEIYIKNNNKFNKLIENNYNLINYFPFNEKYTKKLVLEKLLNNMDITIENNLKQLDNFNNLNDFVTNIKYTEILNKIIKFIIYDYNNFIFLPEFLTNDKNHVLIFLNSNFKIYEYISKSLIEDINFITYTFYDEHKKCILDLFNFIFTEPDTIKKNFISKIPNTIRSILYVNDTDIKNKFKKEIDFYQYLYYNLNNDYIRNILYNNFKYYDIILLEKNPFYTYEQKIELLDEIIDTVKKDNNYFVLLPQYILEISNIIKKIFVNNNTIWNYCSIKTKAIIVCNLFNEVNIYDNGRKYFELNLNYYLLHESNVINYIINNKIIVDKSINYIKTMFEFNPLIYSILNTNKTLMDHTNIMCLFLSINNSHCFQNGYYWKNIINKYIELYKYDIYNVDNDIMSKILDDITIDYRYFIFLPSYIRCKKSFALEAVKRNRLLFHYILDKWKIIPEFYNIIDK